MAAWGSIEEQAMETPMGLELIRLVEGNPLTRVNGKPVRFLGQLGVEETEDEAAEKEARRVAESLVAEGIGLTRSSWGGRGLGPDFTPDSAAAVGLVRFRECASR